MWKRKGKFAKLSTELPPLRRSIAIPPRSPAYQEAETGDHNGIRDRFGCLALLATTSLLRHLMHSRRASGRSTASSVLPTRPQALSLALGLREDGRLVLILIHRLLAVSLLPWQQRWWCGRDRRELPYVRNGSGQVPRAAFHCGKACAVGCVSPPDTWFFQKTLAAPRPHGNDDIASANGSETHLVQPQSFYFYLPQARGHLSMILATVGPCPSLFVNMFGDSSCQNMKCEQYPCTVRGSVCLSCLRAIHRPPPRLSD